MNEIESLKLTIKEIKQTINYLEDTSKEYDDLSLKAQIESEKIKLEALEKQIPKKVDTSNINKFVTHYICPSCGRLFWEKDYIGKYCDNCGQALEVEDE